MTNKKIYKWPSRLPKPYYNFSYEPKNSFIRTPMQSGIARHRIVNENVNMKVLIEIKIPRENQDDFLFFVHKIVGDDCNWGFFDMPLIFGEDEKMFRVRFSNPETPYKVINSSNKLWVLSAEMEIVDFNFMSESDFFNRNPDSFETAIDPLNELINVDMPEYFKEK